MEKVAGFIKGLTVTGFILLILVCFLPVGIGGAFIHNLMSVPVRGFNILVAAIQNAKNYVRSNGTKYNEAEKIIYYQGITDFMTKLSEGITDQKVKEQINLIRAQL